MKEIDNDVLEDILDVLELAMVMDEDKIEKLYQQGRLKQCNTGKII